MKYKKGTLERPFEKLEIILKIVAEIKQSKAK